MKKSFKYILYLIFLLLVTIALYFFIAYIFTFFPKKAPIQADKRNIVYILYSKLHSDIIFNIKDINLSNFSEFNNKKNGYLAFGWGDKETYLNTPNINNIKISTSLKALFINTPSVMHVSYIPNILRYKNIKSIRLSNTQQIHLKKSIMKSFTTHKIVYKGYEREDFFYTANGEYNLFKTCNTWTGDKLRESNVSMSYWTPLSQNIINLLP